MSKLISIILSFLKSIVILWLPILLIEETFLYDYIGSFFLVFSIIASIECLIVYIKTYKKNVVKVNCYCYNIVNAILLIIINVVLGYFFLYLIDIGVFHQCKGSGWDCFLFGVEYLFIGFEYAFLTLIALVIWLLVRLIKFLNSRLRNN